MNTTTENIIIHDLRPGDMIVRTIYRQDGYSAPGIARFGEFPTVLTVIDIAPTGFRDEIKITMRDSYGELRPCFAGPKSMIEVVR